MEQRNIVAAHQKNELRAAKTAKIYGYARVLRYVLVALCLVAIWQEKRLAPPVHDGMQIVAGKAMEYIHANETLSELITTAHENYVEFTSDS